MEKSVRKFSTFEAAEEAEIEYYASLSHEERLKVLFSLIGYTEHNGGTIERSVRIYPINESEEG